MISDILWSLFYILIYPGIFFLAAYGLFCQWVDRKLYAQMQNRQGARWYQPLADFVKLLAKEVIIPDNVTERTMFKILPFIAIAAITTTALMIPFESINSVLSFQGNLIAAVYLLSIPTITFFLIGWSSQSPYSAIGSMRVLTQLFAYEVPLMLVLLAPAILAGTWNISEIAVFFTEHPALMLTNILGFLISLISLQGKLERVPFDIPHAETEIVGGVFTEYSGRLYGFIKLAVDMEMVVVAALLNAIFLGGSFGLTGILGFAVFVVKTLIIVFFLSLIRSLMARVRIEQMISFCWKVLAPLSLVQIIISVLARTFFNI
ncbi:NADH-quinone oxidoreductase subunit H [Elusimicrobium posterum]|uniref:complex I subunit 1 family protein n=1 Tax=Elusimicrobium posterum TaxID=3116653 RepID=UPI003C76F9D7